MVVKQQLEAFIQSTRSVAKYDLNSAGVGMLTAFTEEELLTSMRLALVSSCIERQPEVCIRLKVISKSFDGNEFTLGGVEHAQTLEWSAPRRCARNEAQGDSDDDDHAESLGLDVEVRMLVHELMALGDAEGASVGLDGGELDESLDPGAEDAAHDGHEDHPDDAGATDLVGGDPSDGAVTYDSICASLSLADTGPMVIDLVTGVELGRFEVAHGLGLSTKAVCKQHENCNLFMWAMDKYHDKARDSLEWLKAGQSATQAEHLEAAKRVKAKWGIKAKS